MLSCTQGECWKNPTYMVGDELQATMKGYCRLSCGTCLPTISLSGSLSMAATEVTEQELGS